MKVEQEKKKSNWAFFFLSSIASTMSIVALIQYSTDIGWSATGALLLGYWVRFIDIMFGWIDQPLQMVVAWIADVSGLELALRPVWKHVLVLLIIATGGALKASFDVGAGGEKEPWLLVGRLALMSVVFSLTLGLIPMNQEMTALILSLLAGFFVAVAIGFIGNGRSRQIPFDVRVGWHILSGFIGAAVFVAGNAGLSIFGL